MLCGRKEVFIFNIDEKLCRGIFLSVRAAKAVTLTPAIKGWTDDCNMMRRPRMLAIFMQYLSGDQVYDIYIRLVLVVISLLLLIKR